MQNKGHYAIQGHSRSPILVQIDFLLVTNEQFHTKVNPTAKNYISANAQFKVFYQ